MRCMKKKIFRDFPKTYNLLHTNNLRLHFFLDNNVMYVRLVVKLKNFDNDDLLLTLNPFLV